MAKSKAPNLKSLMMQGSMPKIPKESKADALKDKKLGMKENPIESKERSTKKNKKAPAKKPLPVKKPLPWSSQNK